jgi:hypothetical protein
MGKFLFSALLAAFSAQAQSAPAAIAIQPPVDTVQERQALRKLTICITTQRPRWARSMLSYPYLSDAQASAAAEITKGNDHCLNAPEAQVAFRTSGVVSAAAEHFVRTEMPKADSKQLASALATVTPLNVSEDFALCLAARNPSAALDLALSDPGSAGETEAVSLVAAGVPSCTKPTERLDVDLQSIRALVTTALYRGMTTVVRSY